MGGDTTVFKYDKGGNLQYKKVYAYSAASGNTYNELLSGTSGKTKNYGYAVSGNKDTLTSYNGSGMLEYDDYGNPKKWFKHGTDGSSLGYSLSWGHVSNLNAITDDADGTTYTYKYNDQGIRTEKVVDGVVHKYYLQGEQIIAEKYGNNFLKFCYDATGVCGFSYNGTDYYYQKNIHCDILRIYNQYGTLYAAYDYDAWGKCTIKINISNMANINPFRYRGYYCDKETGLYYLNARYYDPEIGRFISPDSIDYIAPNNINGLNLYIYCLNNPIRYVDKVAHAPQENVIGFTDTFAFSEMIFAVATAYMYGLAKLANRLDVLTMVIKMASKASSIFKFLGYASVAINTVANIVINVQKGVSIDRIISDAIVDIGIGVGVIALSTAIGATIGSAVPGIGNLIGGRSRRCDWFWSIYC